MRDAVLCNASTAGARMLDRLLQLFGNCQLKNGRRVSGHLELPNHNILHTDSSATASLCGHRTLDRIPAGTLVSGPVDDGYTAWRRAHELCRGTVRPMESAGVPAIEDAAMIRVLIL